MAIEIVEQDINPICPHSDKELSKIIKVKNSGFFNVKSIICCPYCKKILGISGNS